jgi:hypothetical protein
MIRNGTWSLTVLRRAKKVKVSLRLTTESEASATKARTKILSNLSSCFNTFRPLTNVAIEEDCEEPKEASHLDYRYLRSYEGPLSVRRQLPIDPKVNPSLQAREEEDEGRGLLE